MNRCKDIRSPIILYLDDELQGTERTDLEAHLTKCEACLAVFESERQFLEIVRGSSQPVASPELRARVTAILSNSETPHLAPTELRLRVQRAIWQLSPVSSAFNSARSLLVGLTIALVLLSGVWWTMRH